MGFSTVEVLQNKSCKLEKSLKCYLVSLRYIHVPFTYICQSNWHVYISTYFQNVNKPLTLHSSPQKNSPQFRIYTENKYM